MKTGLNQGANGQKVIVLQRIHNIIWNTNNRFTNSVSKLVTLLQQNGHRLKTPFPIEFTDARSNLAYAW
jgi:hypothetical protein